MKKITFIFVLLAAISSFSFIEETLDLIVPGKGIDGYVTVDVTTKREVIVKFGNDFEEIKNYTGEGENKSVYSIKQVYKKQGVSFYYWPDSDTLFCVYISAPYKAKTDKGIIPGKSTMQDVEDAYGKTEWFFAGERMFLEYPGITFYVPFNGKFPVKQKTMDEAMKKKVQIISVKKFDE